MLNSTLYRHSHAFLKKLKFSCAFVKYLQFSCPTFEQGKCKRSINNYANVNSTRTLEDPHRIITSSSHCERSSLPNCVFTLILHRKYGLRFLSALRPRGKRESRENIFPSFATGKSGKPIERSEILLSVDSRNLPSQST